MDDDLVTEHVGFGRSAGVLLSDVFDTSYRKLVVQLYGVVGDLAEAEDVVQEAFVRAAAAGWRFTGTDNPEAWLRTTAINVHRSRWRKLRNFSRIKERLHQPVDAPGLEARIDVIDGLRSLSPDQRAVVALHHLADLSVTEIAQHLGVPEGTVKSRLKRGRDTLAQTLRTAEEIDHV
jgi:RNA polymerase sigma-70 factor, ECF subfamily